MVVQRLIIVLSICRCKGAENTDTGGIPFPVFVVVCTKFELRPGSPPMNVRIPMGCTLGFVARDFVLFVVQK